MVRETSQSTEEANARQKRQFHHEDHKGTTLFRLGKLGLKRFDACGNSPSHLNG
jgi:hypothetical protein